MIGILDGVKYATIDTLKDLGQGTKALAGVAGEAAGHIATVAGESAGKVLSGFWRTSGMAGYVFVGAAILAYTKGWV